MRDVLLVLAGAGLGLAAGLGAFLLGSWLAARRSRDGMPGPVSAAWRSAADYRRDGDDRGSR